MEGNSHGLPWDTSPTFALRAPYPATYSRCHSTQWGHFQDLLLSTQITVVIRNLYYLYYPWQGWRVTSQSARRSSKLEIWIAYSGCKRIYAEVKRETSSIVMKTLWNCMTIFLLLLLLLFLF